MSTVNLKPQQKFITRRDIESSITEVKFDFKLLVINLFIFNMFITEIKNNLEEKYNRKITSSEIEKISKFTKKYFKRKQKTKKTGYRLRLGTAFSGLGCPEYVLSKLNVPHTSVFAIEKDKFARQTLEQNYDIETIYEDITTVDETKLGKTDLYIFGSPCQNFSMSATSAPKGRLGLEGETGQLFWDGLKILRENKPKYSIFENVVGLVNHDNGNTFKTIMRAFNELEDYYVYEKIVNAYEVGGNTIRRRIFIVLVRKDIIDSTKTTYNFPDKKVSTKCIKDCLITDIEHTYLDTNDFIPWEKTIEEQRGVLRKSHFYLKATRDELERVYDINYPCPTIQRNGHVLIHDGIGFRLMTPQELKNAQGFGDDMDLSHLSNRQFKSQLGNTMEVNTMIHLISEIVRIDKLHFELTNNSTKPKKVRESKKTVIVNDHISVSKKIMNTPDENYLNLTQHKIDEYKSHLRNGGTISMSIEKYKTNSDKKSKKLKCRYVVTINNLTQLGFRDKKNGIYRVKITGTKEKLDKVGKRDVLITRQGGKGKFIDKFYHSLEDMNILDKKLSVVVDSFFGGGGLTLNLVEKLWFTKYIINDLEPLIYKTMLAIKKDYKKVLDVYQEINLYFQSLIPDELRNYKKDPSVRIDPKLQEIRNKDRRYRDFYREIGNRLNNTELDIYTISGYFIFFNNKSTNGTLTFQKDGSIDITNCNNETTLKDKTHMVKYWSYLLNKHNIEIMNKDVFEVLEDIPSDGLVFSDGPYCSVSMNYGMDNSSKFQIDLQTTLNRFDNLIYCNEDCDSLYELNLDKGFDNTQRFPRNNKLGCSTKTNGGFEFLGYRSSFMKTTSHSKSGNNTIYKPNKKIA